MKTLSIDRHDTHWAVILNRPEKLNALSAELIEELIAAIESAERNEVPVVAFQGAGRCFSSGFDMTDVESQSEGDLLLRFVRIETLLSRIATSPCFTVAFAHGRNFGAGVDLFAACRMRVAAPGSTFRMPGLKFGLVLGSSRFARIVGFREAARILETAATFDADCAHELGFIERITSLDEFTSVITEAVTRVSELSVESRKLLLHVLDQEQPDADMAALVRSAAAPGIHPRIAAYRVAEAAARRQDT